jgi:murein DD-endopeptidase MepM/ murein hydrolase activator NlpD
MHSGIDLQAAQGTEVYAVRSGLVSAAGWDETLGNYVAVDHGEQKESVYGHLQKIQVSLNQEVKSGTILGTVGSTGKSTGPHLHFEIRVRGEARNPESFIPRMKQ